MIHFIFLGFWLKESTYREQPEVHFKHDLIVIAQGTGVDSLVTYSTFQNYNNLMGDHVRIPYIQVRILLYVHLLYSTCL